MKVYLKGDASVSFLVSPVLMFGNVGIIAEFSSHLRPQKALRLKLYN